MDPSRLCLETFYDRVTDWRIRLRLTTMAIGRAARRAVDEFFEARRLPYELQASGLHRSLVPEENELRYLNLGCGQRFRPEWVNLDLHPAGANVQRWDLQRKLPFSDGSFDVVYHSHVLEHFSKAEGLRFLGECHRVVRPGGIIRVAVPDLEKIARLYIEAFDRSLAGDSMWQSRYEWILLEMYDQTVRRTSGGEMLAYLRQEPIPERDFIKRRLGGEFDRIVAHVGGAGDDKPRKTGLSVRQFISRKLARLALGREGLTSSR